ncbi:MAG TPA: hypothetical protein VI503_05275 [Gaiellaceae bacterium]|nr:hypothetical protein [Gaiellaceae bacterium]
MSELVPEAERLLAVAPEDFVSERKALARRLRDEGRGEDAAAVERMRKPSRVVFAVNRGARDRPKAAQAAADAAERVKELQLGGDPDAFREALRELDDAIALLADVAVAHVAASGRPASEAMRQRVRELLRSAVADDDAHEALARGVLTEELEAPGFSPFAGMTAPTPSRKQERRGPSRAEQREEERRAQARALRAELESAERALEEATHTLREAERARAAREREVDSLRRRLARLE